MSLLNLQGAYENELAATGDFNPNAPKTAFRLPSGQRIVLSTELLLEAMSGSVDAGAVRAKQAVQGTQNAPRASSAVSAATAQEQVIPLVAEEMVVGKTQVETGRVRLRRETEENVQTVNVALANVNWEVEHVAINQVVDAQPEIRQVGETTIFPLVEERMVVKRELWLREEVHVRKVTSVVEKSAEFPVKRDVLIEERTGV